MTRRRSPASRPSRRRFSAMLALAVLVAAGPSCGGDDGPVPVVAKPGWLHVVAPAAAATDLGAALLRIEGPAVDSVQAGPGATAHVVAAATGVRVFVAASTPGGPPLGNGGEILRLMVPDVWQIDQYVVIVEQAASTSYSLHEPEAVPLQLVVGG